MIFRAQKKFLPRFALVLSLTLLSLSLPFNSYAVNLPPESGKVEGVLQGTNGRTLVLIQEAHVDYECQKSIVEILKSLLLQKPLRLILVEGGAGDVSLSYLRDWADPEKRGEVAGRFLREGKISAEEYLDLTTDAKLELWGIEDPALYQKNRGAFLKIHHEQPAILKKVEAFESDLRQQASKVFSPELLRFLEQRKLFLDHRLSLPEYLRELARLSPLSSPHALGGDPRQKHSGMTEKAYPSLALLTELAGEGADLDLSKAGTEKDRLITALSRTVSRLEMDEIVGAIRESPVQQWKSPEEEIRFYQGLFELAGRYPALRAKHPSPNLRRYVESLEQMNQDTGGEFLGELKRLEDAVWNRLAKTEEEKRLSGFLRDTELLRKLFELELGPSEFEELQVHSNPADSSTPSYLLSLNPKIDRKQVLYSLPIKNNNLMKVSTAGIRKSPSEVHPPKLPIPTLERDFALAMEFYRCARAREQALLENTARKMAVSPDDFAVMITGGFHADDLACALHRQGFSVIRISPRFQIEDSGQSREKYFKVIQETSGAAR